jgi:hypothetical protein
MWASGGLNEVKGKGSVAFFALCALALGVMPREQATSKEKFSREPKKYLAA